MRNFYILLAFMSVLPLAIGDSAVLVGASNQIAYYAVEMNKTTPTIGIFTFNLQGTYGLLNETIPQAISNCTITNVIKCSVAFVMENGNYTVMNVFLNGQKYESIPLGNESLEYNAPPIVGRQIINVNTATLTYVGIAIAVILGIVVAGNVIYYEMHKREI